MEEVKLYAMTCGWITMPYGFFMAGETGSLAIPVPCYLIEHPKGTVLFDTGLELPLQSEDESVVKKALGGFADLTTVDFVPGEDVAKRLEAFGVDPFIYILTIVVVMPAFPMRVSLFRNVNGRLLKTKKILKKKSMYRVITI